MKFKEGNSVEILRRVHDPCGSWFPGSIISIDGDCYLVRYDSFTGLDGKPVVEKVHKRNIRPRFPNKRAKKWMAGDVGEVFDLQSWRSGKIVKVLKNNFFVVRLSGFIQLKEFHGSKLRIQQSWHRNKWSVVDKSAQNKEAIKMFKRDKPKLSRSLRKRDKQNHFKYAREYENKLLPRRMVKRSNNYRLDRSPKDFVSRGRGCGKPLARNLPTCGQAIDNTFEKVRASNDINHYGVKEGINWVWNSSGPCSSEDSIQCSVASCSSTDVCDFPSHNRNKKMEDTFDNSDAESSFPSYVDKSLTPYLDENLEANIHDLEFQAYKSTVQALYASGPLSWEQESLLTNLRLSLNISDEEHLLQLRNLLSSQVL